MSAIDQFRSAIEAAGLTPPDEIHGDGRLHHFSPSGKRKDDAGWYVLYLDGTPAGLFSNWRGGLVQCWRAGSEREMSTEERKGRPAVSPALDTAAAAHYLNRRPQTLRGWACNEDGPLRPRRVHGRLLWSVKDIRRLVGD